MTTSRQEAAPAATSSIPANPAHRTTVVATGAAVVAALAWVVAGQLSYQAARSAGLGTATIASLVSLSLVVGALGRVPVGALADRYGARSVLPVLTGTAAVLLPLAGWSGPLLQLVVSLVVVCLGSTVFAAAAGAVVRHVRPRWRGVGVAGLGGATGAGALAAVVLASTVDSPQGRVLVTVGLLLAITVVAATLLRDRRVPTEPTSPWQDVAALLRRRAVRQWCVLYAAAASPLFALLGYLPTYVDESYEPLPVVAPAAAGALIAAAAVARTVGGLLANRRPTRLVVGGYLVAAASTVLVALDPPTSVGLTFILVIAVAVGLAGGVVLGRVGRTVPAERAALVVGLVGAAGVAAGVLPTAALWLTNAIRADYAVGIMLLAGGFAAAGAYARRHHDWINPLGLPLLHTNPAPLVRPEFQSTATTVVALTASDTAADSDTVVAVLSELATRHELVIVYGDRPAAPVVTRELDPRSLVAAVRDRLPRHKIVAVIADADGPAEAREWETVAELVADGAVAVSVVDSHDLPAAAERVAERLGADAVVLLTEDPVHGIGLRRHTRRPVPAAAADEAHSPQR